MNTYYLAIDIGASGGRHILGRFDNGRLVTEDVYRFDNRMVKSGGARCWDLDYLFGEILAGMKQCAELGHIPISVGIDTWGVDYVLLDGSDQIIGKTYAYRDGRTAGMDQAVAALIPPEELYRRTGIQKQLFNTIYQLTALRLQHPDQLDAAQCFLMLPDYFHYRLTGTKTNEYTNATTTQLISVRSKTWDTELLGRLGLPARLFGEVSLPGTAVGRLTAEIRRIVGYDCEVVLPATHDTASAVAAVPAMDEDFIYLSSGTWSLIGTEKTIPDCSEAGRRYNFTNEGGVEYRYRHLKNIMGLWMIQSVRRELNRRFTYEALAEMARQSLSFDTTVDVNDDSFLAPDSMTEAVRAYCVRAGRTAPSTTGELIACLTKSLAKSYAEAVAEIEALAGRPYRRLHIFGGGSRNELLNELTAELTGKEVRLGPVEATATGNLLVQMIRTGELVDFADARACVRASFEIRKVEKKKV